MFGNALSTINGREWRWRPANSLSHRMYASPLPESPAYKFLNFSNTLQKPDLPSASHFPRSKLLYTPEEYSHWLSLMARDLSLGPSDAPWPVETSTVHGESSLWESNLSMGKVNCSRGAAPISANDHGQIPFRHSSPETDSPSEASPPASICRRNLLPTWPTKSSLGFWLEGFTHKLGPLIFLKPKSIIYDPAPNDKNSRSGPITLLLSLKQSICRFLLLAGRRLQKRKKPYSLFWFCNIVLRNLPQAPPMVIVSYSKSLKIYNVLFSIAICRSVDCGFESSMPNYHPTTLFSSEFRQRPCSITPEICNHSSQEDLDLHRRAPDFLLCTLLQSSSDYSGKLLRVDFLVPARSTTWSSSLTSLCLLTVTILSSRTLLIVTSLKTPELFAEVSLTHHNLACDMLLTSLCLRVHGPIFKAFRLSFLFDANLYSKILYSLFSPLLG